MNKLSAKKEESRQKKKKKKNAIETTKYRIEIGNISNLQTILNTHYADAVNKTNALKIADKKTDFS